MNRLQPSRSQWKSRPADQPRRRAGFLLRRCATLLLALACLAGAAFAAEPLGHFDAGKTIVVHVGESFTIILERAAGERTHWIWPHLPAHLLAHRDAGDRTKEGATHIVETHVFTALTPGTAVVFAEKVAVDDPTLVSARYIVTVQVVP